MGRSSLEGGAHVPGAGCTIPSGVLCVLSGVQGALRLQNSDSSPPGSDAASLPTVGDVTVLFTVILFPVPKFRVLSLPPFSLPLPRTHAPLHAIGERALAYPKARLAFLVPSSSQNLVGGRERDV